MIVLTGAAGFIGSNILTCLNYHGYRDVVLVDDFSKEAKLPNYEGKEFSQLVNRDVFVDWIVENHRFIQIVIHIGARTDTAEFDVAVFDALNLNYSKAVWLKCVEFGLPLIYASSAATYGLGEFGYEDSHEIVGSLKPLNPYGDSKNDFDKWALAQERKPYFWAGLKFFNVYGPNEYHKGRMASVVFHSFLQIRETGAMKLFESHRPDFAHGEQMRDFIYVKDVANIILFLMETRKDSGIYNVGTGEARSFRDLTRATFDAMGVTENVSFVPTPVDIRDKYQYFTEANMQKLRGIGYDTPFTSLEDAVRDYVQNYLFYSRFN
ncbi:MAG: hypothetical protein RIS47_1149 [Bacteroidota bacterium]